MAVQTPRIPGTTCHPRFEIVDGVAARARLPRLKVLAVMPAVVVTFQASFPALFDADALDTGL